MLNSYLGLSIACKDITSTPAFNTFIIIVVLFASGLVGADTFYDEETEVRWEVGSGT